MTFEKYHSTGNDFLITQDSLQQAEKIAQFVCNRRFGIGADGILIASPSDLYDIKMTYYNSDGSQAPMCGNGLRAFADYVYRQKILNQTSFVVETLAGPIRVQLLEDGNIEVYLKAPILELDYPDILQKQKKLEPILLNIEQKDRELYILFLGTLHAVMFIKDDEEIDIMKIGKQICHHPFFPNRINVNFVKIINHETVEMSTYERGAGLTLSCGTGASAGVFVSTYLGLTSGNVKVDVPGGLLSVYKKNDQVILVGPTKWVATVNFKGDSHEIV